MKNLKLFVILFSIIFTDECYSQSGWFWQNPLPTGNDYEEIKFFDENTGYAAGYNSTVVKTTNGGDNWFHVNNGIRELIGQSIISYLCILNQSTLIAACSYGGGIIKTTNSGLNWILLNSQITTLSDMCFINDNLGFGVNSNLIYKTTNGGVNWNSTTITGGWKSVYFENENTGFVGGDFGSILVTSNGGANWFATTTGVNTSVTSIQFINQLTGFCASSNYVFKTTNSGLNWVIKCTPNHHSGGELSFSTDGSGYYCNWNGIIYKTQNSGETWDSSYTGILSTSLNSPKNNICLVVGSGGQIFKTSNFGINWNCVSSPFSDIGFLNSVIFPTITIGYICGENGTILKTSNAGINWFKLSVNTTQTLKCIHFINDYTGFCGGANNKLFYTSNGGIIWDSITTPSSMFNRTIITLYFLNSDTGLIGYNNYLYKTTNKGETWYQVLYSQLEVGLMVVKFLNYNIGFCSASERYSFSSINKIYKSTNYGDNWILLNVSQPGYFDDFQMINENVGFGVSYSSVKKTTNGGINWNQVFNQNTYSTEIHFVNENTGYIPGFKTTNSGLNWFAQYLDIQADWQIKSISFIDQDTGFMVGGYEGVIFKTTDGGGTLIPIGLNNLNEVVPFNYSLSQNYPNPFNPQTKIKFDVPSNVKGQMSNVKLVIYDLLGREVVTIVNEELKPGTYEADWDGSNYSSGVYFYKLVAGDFTETKKMVLMK